MRLRAVVLAWAVLVAGCGGGEDTGPVTTGATAPNAPAPTTPVPDLNGTPVLPKPTGSSNPDKAWGVPDADGSVDWVSAADAEYLAAARPAVPYRGPDGTLSNATLIAMGRKACVPAASYQAGGMTVTGPGADAIHRAAQKRYC